MIVFFHRLAATILKHPLIRKPFCSSFLPGAQRGTIIAKETDFIWQHASLGGKKARRIGRDEKQPRISTNYTKAARRGMGEPPAPSDSPSGRGKRALLSRSDYRSGSAKRCRPCFREIRDNSWLLFVLVKFESPSVHLKHMSRDH
jgi:hypothetical protein